MGFHTGESYPVGSLLSNLWHFIGPSWSTFSEDVALNLFQEYLSCNASLSCSRTFFFLLPYLTVYLRRLSIVPGGLRLSEVTLKAASTCGSSTVARATPEESCGQFLRPRAANKKRGKQSFVRYSSQRIFSTNFQHEWRCLVRFVSAEGCRGDRGLTNPFSQQR